MWQQYNLQIQRRWRAAWAIMTPAVTAACAEIQPGLHRAWATMQPRLAQGATITLAFIRGPLRLIAQTLAALLLLFAEWGWVPLENLLSKLSKYFVFARVEAWIGTLPPYGALALFAAPAVCLIPIKLMALYLFATGHAAIGVGLIILAKVVGTAVVARIYMLVRPQLMQIGWFKLGYDRFIPWKERMFVEIRSSDAWRFGRAVRVDVKRTINRTWIELKPQRAWIATLTQGIRGRVQGVLDSLHKSLS